MIKKTEAKSIQHNLSRVLSAAKIFRRAGTALTGMIFTDNWYDSHPRLLIFDPVLNPYDKLVWLTIRCRCTPDMSMTAFPSYDEIQSLLNISRGTVSSSIAKLRMTRWLTLLCRDQERDESGQIIRDGNIYMVHGEPLDLSDTFELDANYMEYVSSCRKHRNSDVRKIAELILASLRHEMDQGQDVLDYQHPFERRAEAWMSVGGDIENSFFGTYPELMDVERLHGRGNGTSHHSVAENTAVHEVDYGDINSLDDVHNENPSVCSNSPVTTSSKEVVKNNNYYSSSWSIKGESELDAELIYPESVTANQKQLIELNLKRLPTNLPSPPDPWDSWHQLLLDELDGRIKAGLANRCAPVWNPVSLMSTYCKRLTENGLGLRDDGQFQIENAESICRQRVERKIIRNQLSATRRRYEQRTLARAMNNKES